MHLTDNDMKRLAVLGTGIKLGLDCDTIGNGVPCREHRDQVVEAMKEYLELNNEVTLCQSQ